MLPVAVRDFQRIKRRQQNPDLPMDSDSEEEALISQEHNEANNEANHEVNNQNNL